MLNLIFLLFHLKEFLDQQGKWLQQLYIVDISVKIHFCLFMYVDKRTFTHSRIQV